MGGGGHFINIHHYHVLINYFIIIELIVEVDSTTKPDMDETVCYDSDEEENDSDITYVESTNEEIDIIVNNPLQHAIVQQGPSQQGPTHQAPTNQRPTHHGPTQQGSKESHVKLITILWKLLKLTVTLIAMQILISLQTQKLTNISPKCQHNVQHIQK